VNSTGHSTGLSLFPPASPCSLCPRQGFRVRYTLASWDAPRADRLRRGLRLTGARGRVARKAGRWTRTRPSPHNQRPRRPAPQPYRNRERAHELNHDGTMLINGSPANQIGVERHTNVGRPVRRHREKLHIDIVRG
jgi:hypothetical protein